jgi:hypothetical protein
MMSGEGTPQAANGASVEAVNIFNAALLGTNDPANPIDIFSFEVVAGAVWRSRVHRQRRAHRLPR